MKKEYITPDLELIVLMMENVCGDVIHASNEHGGTNSGWSFGDDDDDDNWGDTIW